MTASPHRIIAVSLDEPSVRDERFETPMIPGARERGMLTTFGWRPALILADSPITMDAATIAARQREGGGAPNQRRPPRNGSLWDGVRQALRRVLNGVDRN